MGDKVVKKILIIVCIIAMVLPFSSEVLAKIVETKEGTKQKFGIELLHESKTMSGEKSINFGYRIDTKDAYRLYSGDKDFETTVLCLDKTARFPQEVDSDGVMVNKGDYVSLGEATEESLVKAKEDITSTDAKKIQWLIKNALLPEDSEELREQKLAKIFNSLMSNTSTTQNPLTLEEIKEILTEDDVVFALQATLWGITNHEKIGTLSGTTDGETWDGLNGNDKWGYQGKKGAYINEIMNYYNAQLEGDLKEDTTPKTNPEFNNTTIEDPIPVEGAYAFVGPFNIKEATNYYTIDIEFADAAGNNLENINYTLVDRPSNVATVLPQTKESLEGKDFYIRLRANTIARKVKFNLKTQVQTTSAVGTVWVGDSIKAQPVLTIERKEQPGTEIPYEKEFDIIIKKEYDVSLRKYISIVKRKTVTGNWQIIYNPGNEAGADTRVPEGPLKATEKNPFNQYDYLHKKQPLEVKVGDRIEYTIVVTNEGEKEAIVKSITDHLPPSGIEYVADDDININADWQYSKENRKVITTITNNIVLAPKENTKVKIVCEVTEAAEGKVITNIAEISEISDENNMVITDVDSKPNNIVLPKTEKEWQEYKGNDSDEYRNKDDLNDSKYYYKGQEDDDDFEKITVPGTIDLALRKSIETVNGNAKDRKKDPNTTPLKDGTDTTSIFTDVKTPVSVKTGDVVVYTIRVFNEGKTEASVGRIEDYIPEGLGFMPFYDLNIRNGWVLEEGTKTLKLSSITNATSNLSQSDFAPIVTDYKNTDVIAGKATIATEKLANEIIAPYNKTEDKLDSREVQIACIVLGTVEPETIIKNIAAITEYKDSNGNVIEKDIDSDTTTPINPDTYPLDDHIQDDDDFEKLILKETAYDLALKKFITKVTSADGSNREIPADQLRKLVVKDVAALVNRKDKEKADAIYELNKKTVDVAKGEYVTYTIRIFNEGLQDGIAQEIIDTVPAGLEFATYEKNADGSYKSGSRTNWKYGWEKFNNSQEGWKDGIKTTYLSDTSIPAFDKTQKTDPAKNIEKGLSYVDVQVEFRVATSKREEITNIAEISKDDGDDNDSTPNNKKPEEDDQDYDVVIPMEYDLALKKFITEVTGEDGNKKTLPESQKRKIEVTDVSELVNRDTQPDGKADAQYNLNKTPVEVVKGDTVTYTIRVFNEGPQDAIVKEIVDNVPAGLEFVTYEKNSDGTYKSGSKTNFKYGWEKFDNATAGWNEGIRTIYLSNTVIPAFDETQKTDAASHIEKGLSYIDVQVEFKVVTSKHEEIKNIAEITDDDGDDNDSTPNNKKPEEDDQDYDVVIPLEFDLSLRKFITQIDDEKITEREPKVTYKDDKLTYTHTKEPEIVVKGQEVIYTIRVYNEGTQEGYAAEIKDDLPEGITFLPKHETNKEYGWKMYDKDGKETDDVTKAISIKTPYLSKEESEKRGEDNLLKPFNSKEEVSKTNPDYRDVKVAFEVTQDSVTDGNKVIINTAEISKDEDKYGNEVNDIDSTPDNNKDGEDDIDKEYIELKYFDLSLLKYVSKVIVTEDGVTKETETKYDGTENPEPVVKVELNKKKLDKTQVKYVYSIKITNEGEIEGYAKEVTDRIPDGLAFYEEDNTEYKWKIKEDGIVTTDYLKDTLLKPGESTVIQIVLRWVNSETNLGQKVNVAEISEDENEYNVPDIDSTPNNNIEGEDDQDSAIVVLSIKTGSAPIYITLIITIMAILASGSYLIYKCVIKK